MIQTVRGGLLRRLLISAAANVELNKQLLNDLNVFPGPDGDTGTNMAMTINTAAADLKKVEDPSLEKAAATAASAMLRGARGNSGVILSLLFRGISKKLKGHEECDGVLWGLALQEGVDAAYKAVMKPAEGTILTVIRESVDYAVSRITEKSTINSLFQDLVTEMHASVDRTPDLLPQLKEAGVVDSGGAGLFYIMDGINRVLNGEDITGKKTIEINQAGIARTFQNIRLFNNMTVIRNVLVGLHNQPEFKCNLFESIFRLPRHFKVEKEMRAKAKELLRIFDLEDERNNLACNLPYGKQRKLEIARALATNPKLLLLDEPAAGMNPHETEDLVKTIKIIREQFDMTILLIEHDMKFVSGLCDEITVLNFGTVLAEGDTKAALSNPEVIKAYIGG